MPRATLMVFALTAIFTTLQHFFPVLVAVLQRAPGMLASGQWWRLVTPILVNPEGWHQIIVNFVGIFVIGLIVERQFGSARWLVLYLVGAVVGELAGMVWQPVGAGSSVAVCGLLGGLAAWLLWRKTPIQPRFGGAIILLGALVLTFMRNLHGPPMIAGALAAGLMLSREAAIGRNPQE